MNVLKRLKNLWQISELEVSQNKEDYKLWSTLKEMVGAKKMASIVDLEDPLQIDLGEETI